MRPTSARLAFGAVVAFLAAAGSPFAGWLAALGAGLLTPTAAIALPRWPLSLIALVGGALGLGIFGSLGGEEVREHGPEELCEPTGRGRGFGLALGWRRRQRRCLDGRFLRCLGWRLLAHIQGIGVEAGLGQLVTRHRALGLGGIVADALDLVVRRLQLHRRDDDDVGRRALLDVGDFPALLVQEVGRDVQRHAGAHDGTALLERLLLEHAQDRQRQGFDAADPALTVAPRADLRGEFVERWTQPLPRHLEQTEA